MDTEWDVDGSRNCTKEKPIWVSIIATAKATASMIQALVHSYRVAPLGGGVPLQAMGLVLLLGQLLAKGFQLAFPVLAVLFLMDLVLGISGKFMPQLQLLQLSFPLKIGLGMMVLGLMLRELSPWLMPLFEQAPRIALRLLG